MKIDRTGIILYVQKYEECIHFYRHIIGLKIMFKTASLSCFEFGGCYLMVEIDDENTPNHVRSSGEYTCLRMNVANVKALADKLGEHNIAVNYQEHSWGTIAKFRDPDGNLCAFKDSEKFEMQFRKYQLNC